MANQAKRIRARGPERESVKTPEGAAKGPLRVKNPERRCYNDVEQFSYERGQPFADPLSALRTVEDSCRGWYRIERYSRPARAWEVVVYAETAAAAWARASELLINYTIHAPHYTAVRIVAPKGKVHP